MAGDSGLAGWGTFLVYVVAAWLCFRNARVSTAPATTGVRRIAQAQSRRRFWGVLAVLMLLLGCTRQFNLQALVAMGMRNFLLVDDLYAERSGLQVGLIIAIGGFGTIGLLIALFTLRRAEASVLTALIAAAALLVFTVIRIISLHAIDQFLALAPLPYIRVGDLIELVLLTIVAVASFAFVRGLRSENESARLRALSIQERRRLMGEKRRSTRS